MTLTQALDELVTAATAINAGNITAGIPLKPQSGGAATGRLFLQTETISTVLPASLSGGKAHAPSDLVTIVACWSTSMSP